MWTTVIKSISFNGSVMADIGGGSHVPLKGILVDVYRFSIDGDGNFHFERLNQVTQRTDTAGDFSFSALPVSVDVQTVIPGSPPYTPVELTRPDSLPNLAFRISVEAEVLIDGASEGTQFVDIYDEREVIDHTWLTSHPERLHVPLSGSPSIQVLIPEGNEKAILIAGVTLPPITVDNDKFHFLRVGRAIRQEIGELGDIRLEYVGKPGYMRSTDTWAIPEPSFFGSIIDAPFGGTLHIGGQFGANLLIRDIYYTVSVWEYSGNPADPLSPGTEVQILDPLFNKRYKLPTAALPNGKWDTLNLGPFDATITGVEPPHDPGIIGTSVKVYRRPALPNLLTEYWPFWDLIVIWNSATSPNNLRILSLEAYEKTGGSYTNPELRKLAMTPPLNNYHHLPLQIDNRPPVPVFLPFDPVYPTRKFHTAYATFLGAPESVGPSTPMAICNEMSVTPGQPNGNECILVKYSIEDGSGNPHQHLGGYNLRAEFTPKAVAGAPDSVEIALKDSFSGYNPISMNYAPVTPPVMAVSNFKSVVVPAAPDGWPPENGDTWALPTGTCPQYALEVALSCWVRTIDGWGHIFGSPHVSRHIIIKRV